MRSSNLMKLGPFHNVTVKFLRNAWNAIVVLAFSPNLHDEVSGW